MSKREEFITVVNTLKALSSTITSEQRNALLQQAVQQYDISIDEANEILKATGLIVGERINYFEVLGFSLEELQNESENNIAIQVDAAHKKQYSESLRAGGLPRRDGRTQEQWRTLLNQARDTLKDPQKRQQYLTTLLFQEDLSKIPLHDTSSPENRHHDSEPATVSPPEDALLPKPSSVDSAQVVPTPNASGDMMLIPAGEFQMGSNNGKADNSERPLHNVYVDAFYMDKHLVTNAQYMEFVTANPQWHKSSKWYEWGKKQKTSIAKRYHDGDYLKHWHENIYPDEKADHPVTWVSWYAAMAYARWIGKRLPTEAEWEKAARGGLTEQEYPGGNSIDFSQANYNSSVGDTTPVGEYPANGYGLYDMAGNAWEWCLDTYDADFYTHSPHRNPISGANTDESVTNELTNNTSFRVLRGGSWLDSQQYVRSAFRYKINPTLTLARIGFRCVKAVTS
ncbi:MAG: SUMF1/EgtB/PvdO family nonheme iron enzyme [Candidatus Poribacteria bacterium]|nr:SUMF1/EgtB/PvdO family nonheme iron enzyme [Candidatus Poribacteria bacterium]